MPWLAGTALLHSAVVMEKRDALKIWTILLAIVAFSLSLMGTFLVRSGVLTSVHAFAVDSARGFFILGIMIVFIGGALALFASRAHVLRQGGIFAPVSREGALVLNNLLITTACAAVFIGTLYPLALEAVTGDKISVGPPFFNLTFGPLMVPLLIAIPFGPFLAWKRGDLLGTAQRLLTAMVVTALAIIAGPTEILSPVENASFMPWLAGTALLHSAVVMEKRDALKIWTILLAIVAFSLSLMGTFLVRSGVLTSVHAFAVDSARGFFILGIMMVFIGGALALFASRAHVLRQGGIFAPISREGALVLNNLLITTACAAVFIGTLYPLALEAVTGDKISVGPPFFNLTFGPLMVPLLIAIPFGPFLAWKRGDLLGTAQRLLTAMVVTALAIIAAYAISGRGPWLAPLGIGMGVWVIAGALSELAFRTKMFVAPWDEVFRRLRNLPRSSYGTAFAHIGVGVMVLGIVATSVWQTEKIIAMKPGGSTFITGYELRFEGVAPSQGPNYREQIGLFIVLRDGVDITRLMPAKRLYDAPKQATTEAGIHASWAGDLYTVLGDELKDGAFTVRLYFNPLVRLIWIGTLIMFFGGLISLLDRRLRVGVPKRARKTRAAAAPAE